MFTCVCVCVLVCVCAREEQRMEKSFAMLVNISLGHEVLGLVEERARTSVWVRSHCVFDTCSLMHFLLVASLRLGACVCTCVFVCVCVWGGVVARGGMVCRTLKSALQRLFARPLTET